MKPRISISQHIEEAILSKMMVETFCVVDYTLDNTICMRTHDEPVPTPFRVFASILPSEEP